MARKSIKVVAALAATTAIAGGALALARPAAASSSPPQPAPASSPTSETQVEQSDAAPDGTKPGAAEVSGPAANDTGGHNDTGANADHQFDGNE